MQLQMIKLKKLKLIEEFNNLCLKEKTLGEEDFSVARLKRLKKKNKKFQSWMKAFFYGEKKRQKKKYSSK